MMLVIKVMSIQSENEERPVNGPWRYSANTEGTHFHYIQQEDIRMHPGIPKCAPCLLAHSVNRMLRLARLRYDRLAQMKGVKV